MGPDLVRAFPSVRARLERAPPPWCVHLVRVPFELLRSSEGLVTMLTAGQHSVRRVGAPNSLAYLDVSSKVRRLRGFRW